MSQDEYRHYAVECLLLARELRDSAHKAVLLAMADAWIAFARKGDPNHPGIPKWPAFSADKGPVMIFDNKCEVKSGPDRSERLTVTG